MDETPFYMSIPPSETLESIQSNSLIISTLGQESIRVSVLLTFLQDGIK